MRVFLGFWLRLTAPDAFPLGEWYAYRYYTPYRDADPRFTDYAR